MEKIMTRKGNRERKEKKNMINKETMQGDSLEHLDQVYPR